MSRTTTALKRLGVPSLAAVTLVAGLPLFLGTAQAAHIASLTLTPETTNEAAGVCVPFTAQLNFSSGQAPRVEEIDVVLTESGSAAQQSAQDVTFCTAPTGNTTPAAPQGATSDGNTDRAEFTTDSTGKVTFGIVSNTDSTAPVLVRAFYEVDGSPNNNNRFDAGEFTDTSEARFTAGGTQGSNANQDAAEFVEVVGVGEPAVATATVTANNDTDDVVETETRTYRVFVGNDANGTSGVNGTQGSGRLSGVTVSFSVNSGVDSADRGPAVFGVTDNNGIATGTITFPARNEASGTTSQDVVTFFVNQTGLASTPGVDGPAATGEPRDTLTVTVRDAATQQNRSLTLSPESQTFSGSAKSATFTATVRDTRTTGATDTTGTLIVFGVSGGSGDETVTTSNPAGGASNECTTVDVSAANNDSTCVVTVNDPTPTVGQVLTVSATVRGNASASDTSTLTFVNRPSDARFVDLEPETVTVAPNTAQQLTARVTDVDGNPVRNVSVRFTESGPGAFRNGNSTVFATTDANGVATVEIISLPGETGTNTVTADISEANSFNGPNQCGNAANDGTDPQGNALNSTNNTGAAGVCADSVTVTFGTASPSPSASPTGTTSPTPASPGASTPPSNVDCSVTPTVDILDATIIATGGARIRVNAPANSTIEVLAYSRPSTTYRVVRRAEINADGDPANFLVTPPTNTRLYAQIVGCDTDEVRFSKVINVRTQLSLNVERLGKQTYRFFGDSLPARRGGLIVSLYRVTDSGRQVLTSQVRANELGAPRAGEYSITRTFTGTGRFGFVVRTGQDLQNAPGSSNVRSLLIF